MIIAEAYLDPKAFKTLPDFVRQLPEPVRPTHFGQSEEKKDRFPLSRSARLLGHLDSMYLLFAGETTYLVEPGRRGYVEIFVSNERDLLEPEQYREILRHLTNHRLKFGLVACRDEYVHRNVHVYPLPSGRAQSGVGRDLTRYLPGLYWTNVLSKDIAEKFEVKEDRLPKTATVLDFGSDYLAFQLFDRPDDWPKFAEQIDGFCEANKKIFSLRRIREQLDKAPNYLALTELLAQWR